MLPCQLRYVAVSWLCCVPLCTCRSWIPWHMVAQHIPAIWLVGTWLPNSTPFSTLRHVTSSAHGCPTHVLINFVVHSSSISLDELHTGCDTIWHLLFIWSGGYMYCTIDIFYLVYMIWLTVNWSTLFTTFHAHPYAVFLPCPLLLFGCEFIGTPVDSDFYMFRSMYISTLRYLAAPDVMSWRYSILWSCLVSDLWSSQSPFIII